MEFESSLGGTSIAVLTYIGFDGISTLSEEAENPRRNILLATVLTCFVIGILSAIEVYAAQLIWPATEPFPDSDTAFTFVAGRAWKPMFAIVGFTLLVANFGSGMGAQIGAARLLFGMGRSKALPQAFFGKVDPKRHVPRNNVLFVGAIALIGALLVSFDLFSYGLGAEMLNFGALIAFMGVNLAAFVRYYVREKKNSPIPPLLLTALVIVLVLWPGSNWIILAAAGAALVAVCRLDSTARWIHHLLLSLEKSQLESLDRRRHLDGRRHRLRSMEDKRFPRRPGELRPAAGRRVAIMLGTTNIIAFVPTRDPVNARAFYEGVLGLRFVKDDGFALVLDANGIMVRVAKSGDFTPAPFTILGWEVSDVAKVAARLKEKGVAFERFSFFQQDELGIWTAPTGDKVAWFKDPDGNTLSISEHM